MNDNRLCNKCGLLPQIGVKPQPPCGPKCGYKAKKCRKDCCSDGFIFRKVVIPAALGDDKTGKDKPANGAYANSYVVYEANGAEYMYDSYGVYTKLGQGGGPGETNDFNVLDNRPKYKDEPMTGETNIPDFSDDISVLATGLADETLARQTADSGLQDAIDVEATNRQLADNGLQSQIDAITVSSDVKDVVGTYAQLQAYDTSTLGNNDIIKVLQDESLNDETTYYRWNVATEQFVLIGEEGPYYTKSQANSLLQDKLDISTVIWGQAANNGVISGNITLSPADTVNWGTGNPSIIGNGMSSLMLRSGVLDSDSAGQYSQLAVGRTGIVLDHYTDGAWERKALLSGVADGISQYDAVNKGQLDAVAASAGGIPIDAAFWGQAYNSATNKVDGPSIILTQDGGAQSHIVSYGSSGSLGQLLLGVGSSSTARNSRIIISPTAIGMRIGSGTNARATTTLGPQYLDMGTKRIIGVDDPISAQDVATKNYVDSIYPVGAVLTSTSATAPIIAGGTWTEIGTQTVGSATVYYYERTA